jgi:hypothetical protein
MIEQQKAEAYVREKLPELQAEYGRSKSKDSDEWCIEYTYAPQLQHWLRVIPWDTNALYFSLTGCICDRANENKVIVIFNMLTGQPATEADYKAFNDIVG